MTRDSVSLKILSIAAIVLAIVAAVTDPATLGIPPIVFNWIKLLSTIVGTLSGWASTSWLPGKNDAGRVTPPTNLPVVLLAVAIAGSFLLSACAPKAAPALPDLASTVTMTEAQLRDQVGKVATVLDVALENIRDINAAEKIAEPQMNDATKRTARALMTAAVDEIQQGGKSLRAGVTSYAALKRTIDPVLAKLGDLQKFVTGLSAGEKAAGGFGALVGGLVRFAFAMLNPEMFGYSEPTLAGGVR